MLFRHYLNIYFRVLKSATGTFGWGTWLFYYLTKLPAKVCYVHVSLFLDRLFFPGFQRVKIEKPVFIIGHPRSGTTFLHTLLTPTQEFVVFKEWELNHPSLTARRLLRVLPPLRVVFSLIADLRYSPYRILREIRRRTERGVRKAVEDYEGNLELISQEEELLFLHDLDTQFLTLETPLGFSEEGYPELVFNDDQPHQYASVKLFEGFLKRQIYATGKKQVIAKINFSLFRLKTLLRVFPDAKVIYLVRSPLETIPSHFSLHRRLLDKQFGLDNIPPPKLKRYFEHRYQYNIQFYKYYNDLVRDKAIPAGQLLEVRYDSLKSDLRGAVDRMKEFSGLAFSAELEDTVAQQAQRQHAYARPHKNLTLEELDLSEAGIRRDFSFVFAQYGF